MHFIQPQDLTDLAQEHLHPCVSIYLPTHPGGCEEDSIRWNNLIRQANQQLEANGIDLKQRDKILEHARALNQPCYWLNTGFGVAHFASADFNRTISLSYPPEAQAVVGSRFRILPLLRLLRSANRFYVLAISMNDVRLLHCEAGKAESIALPNMPTSFEEALREHDRDDAISFHTVAPGAISGQGVMYHGHGVGIDDSKTDQLRYFQRINKEIMEILHSESAPLVLASVASLWPIYQEANKYPHLLMRGIPGNPDFTENQVLMEKALPIAMEPAEAMYAKTIDHVMDQSTTGQMTHDLNTVVTAAQNGLVEILIIQDRFFEPKNGIPEEAMEAMDIAASCTLEHRGKVMVVANGLMPETIPFIGLMRKTSEKSDLK